MGAHRMGQYVVEHGDRLTVGAGLALQGRVPDCSVGHRVAQQLAAIAAGKFIVEGSGASARLVAASKRAPVRVDQDDDDDVDDVDLDEENEDEEEEELETAPSRQRRKVRRSRVEKARDAALVATLAAEQARREADEAAAAAHRVSDEPSAKLARRFRKLGQPSVPRMATATIEAPEVWSASSGWVRR